MFIVRNAKVASCNPFTTEGYQGPQRFELILRVMSQQQIGKAKAVVPIEKLLKVVSTTEYKEGAEIKEIELNEDFWGKEQRILTVINRTAK